MIPEGELGTGLAQVSRPKAIIDHGMVEHGAETASHYPCPLAACPTVIRQHRAVGGMGWCQVATPSSSPEPAGHQVIGHSPSMFMSSGSCLRPGLKPLLPWDLCTSLFSVLLPLKVTTSIHRTLSNVFEMQFCYSQFSDLHRLPVAPPDPQVVSKSF